MLGRERVTSEELRFRGEECCLLVLVRERFTCGELLSRGTKDAEEAELDEEDEEEDEDEEEEEGARGRGNRRDIFISIKERRRYNEK